MLPMVAMVSIALLSFTTHAQEKDVTAGEVAAAIDKLGAFDFTPRMTAARTVRRARAEVAVPALLKAVAEHGDGFVRFRALVLLSGFNDPRTPDVMAQVLGDANDRLRAVAYAYFEHNRDPQILPRLIDALAREESEFVRPALTRAIVAAAADDQRAKQQVPNLVMKGQDYFRSIVIEAVGDYRVTSVAPQLVEIAKLEGPLQDDAVLALGKLGDKQYVGNFAALQSTAPRAVQPAVAAAICLAGVNCASHAGYLTQSLKFGIENIGFQELLRAAANGLAALAEKGNEEALNTLLDAGAPTRDPARSPIALAIGTVALRNTPLLLKVLETRKSTTADVELLRDAFDMLEEDFEEERFYVTVRKGYWQAPAGSRQRAIAEALIQKLEF
jgi:HEAT repeat protein